MIRLQNACMSVSVMPQLGGKIHEIVDLRTQRDWLWKNPYISLCHPTPNMNYDAELDSGGWDEILFSVKPCTFELPGVHHTSIGDHGLAIDKPWHNIETRINDTGDAVCDLFVEGQSPNFRFRRSIVMDTEHPRLDFEYRLTNTGSTPWPWLWCAHPLLAVETGMFINFQEGQEIRLDQRSGDCKGEQAWPTLVTSNGEHLDIAGLFQETSRPETFCAKLFIRSANEICLSTADETESFSMIYSPEALPWLGMWINKNAWSGCGSEPYLNLGLEPATAPYDNLAEAIAQGHADFLQAGESKHWSLTVSLNNKVEAHQSRQP